jgi:ABC-2 type transport system permease protein
VSTILDPPGRPIKGPTALGDSPRRLATLTWTLAVSEFRLTFFDSALGYLWTLMKPLALFGVLFVVFTEFLDFRGNVRFYPVGLLLGIVLYSFVREGTAACVRSLVTRENLVRKVEFPRLAVPLSFILTALFNLLLSLVVVTVFLVASGGSVRWSWLELPVLLVLLVALVTGLSMILSILFVRFRDVEPIWDVVLQVVFYATPIFYSVEQVLESNETIGHALLLNPFAAILQQARHAFIDPSHMSAAEAIGGAGWLLIPLGIIVAVNILGYRIFARNAPRVAEDL